MTQDNLSHELPPPQPPPPQKKRPRRLLLTLLIVGGLCIFPALFAFRSMVAEPFRVPSGSMEPTLLIGDYVLADKTSFGTRYPYTRIPVGEITPPARGDIVVFVYPGSDEGRLGETFDVALPGLSTLDYMKRVIALPGDTVEIKDNQVILNGEPLQYDRVGPTTFTDDRCRENAVEGYVEHLDGRSWTTWRSAEFAVQMRAFGPVTVPEGQLFLLGDNRDHSADSRVWGFVPFRNLKGRVTRVGTSVDTCTGTTRTERSWMAL